MHPYNVTCAGEGTPLLFVNGAFHNRTSFAPLVAGLTEDFKVITFDFPNQAPGTTQPDLLNVADYARITREALLEAKERPADTVVFGLSSGGNVARYMHCCLGVDFKALFLAGANPGGMDNFYTRLHTEYVEGIRAGGIRNFSRMSMFTFFSPQYHVREPSLGDQVHQRMNLGFGHNLDGLIALIESIFHDETLKHPPADFRCPIVLLRGTDDFLVPKAVMQRYLDRCTAPVIKSIEVPGGHAFPMENFSQTEAAVRDAIDTLGIA